MNRELRNDIDLVAIRLKRMGLPYVAKQFKQHPLATGTSWKPLVEDQLFMGNTDRRGMNNALKILWDWTMTAKDQGHQLKPVRFNTAASRVASRYATQEPDLDRLATVIDWLDEGFPDMFERDYLEFGDPRPLENALSDYVSSLRKLLDEGRKEKARLEEEERLREEARLEALVWEQQATRFKNLVKAIPNAVLRTLGNTWDAEKESRSGRDASWDFTPQDWIDAKEGNKIIMTVAKAIAGSVGEVERNSPTSQYDLVVEFPYIRVGISIETDSPDKWAAEEMRERNERVPKKIIYGVEVDVLLWDGE
jgi:hypothetical protein